MEMRYVAIAFVLIFTNEVTESQALLSANEYSIEPNCTENYSNLVTLNVPYTETYQIRSWYGQLQTKTRLNYKTETRTEHLTRQICCSGYEQNQNNTCSPVCSSCDGNKVCTEPETCECPTGYTYSELWYYCKPKCDECINGVCVSPNQCVCNAGYSMNEEGSCKPYCDYCKDNEVCVYPDECQCRDGYVRHYSDGECISECNKPCINGYCASPNTCVCHDGYRRSASDDFECEPICDDDCVNSECVSPNECRCNVGYQRGIETSRCEPYCYKECINATCTSPDTCACYKNYKFIENGDNTTCEPICANDCTHGLCVAPDVCQCDDGYVEKDSKCVVPCLCDNGYCNDTDSHCQSCKEGYELLRSSEAAICTPYCASNCTNGECVEPGLCRCDEPYVTGLDRENQNNSVCIRPCAGKCLNGICLNDNSTCDCLSGWSGRFCDEALLCSMTILQSDPAYLSLDELLNRNDSSVYNGTWPTCDPQCLKKINNETNCTRLVHDNSTGFTCLVSIGGQCNISFLRASDDLATPVISCIFILLIVLIIAILVGLIIRKRSKSSFDLVKKLQQQEARTNDEL